jgi:hypothetical protein
MIAPFAPAADWPDLLPAFAEGIDHAAKRAASTQLLRVFPVAGRLHRVEAWLNAAGGRELLGRLLACMVAADHWRARLACPQGRVWGRALRRYFDARAEAAQPVLTAALVRWAVLACIPVSWLPESDVKIALASWLAQHHGVCVEVTDLRLVPPLAGGREWMARDCGDAVRLLVEAARRGPVAAILHWPGMTEAAVVTSVGDELRAFGHDLSAEGTVVRAGDLLGGQLVPAVEPPASWLQSLARIIGLGGFVWSRMRGRRLRGVRAPDQPLTQPAERTSSAG